MSEYRYKVLARTATGDFLEVDRWESESDAERQAREIVHGFVVNGMGTFPAPSQERVEAKIGGKVFESMVVNARKKSGAAIHHFESHAV